MKSRILFFVVLAFLVVSAGCSSEADAPVMESATDATPADGSFELTTRQFETSGMELGNLAMKPFNTVVKATGMFDVPPQYQATVNSYYGGTVKGLKLIPGEYVKSGQLLFVLENPEFIQIQQDYLEAKGQLAYLKSDFERQRNLAEDNVTSQKNFLKAESDYTVMRVKVESLGKRLELMNIDPANLTVENLRTSLNVTAPIRGYITQVNISRGTFLNPSEPALSIINTDHLHLELNIFEKDLAKVKVGQKIEFAIQDDESAKFPASVHLVNRTVDEANRTIRVHGHLENEKSSPQFSPGMYVEAEIYTTSQSKASLPENTLVELEGKYYTLVLQDSTAAGYTFAQREVEVGEIRDGFAEVLNAQSFDKGARFLTKGAFNLISE